MSIVKILLSIHSGAAAILNYDFFSHYVGWIYWMYSIRNGFNRFIGSENMGLDIKNNILSAMLNELCRFKDLSTMCGHLEFGKTPHRIHGDFFCGLSTRYLGSLCKNSALTPKFLPLGLILANISRLLPPAPFYHGLGAGGQTAPRVQDLGYRRRALHLRRRPVRCTSAHV